MCALSDLGIHYEIRHGAPTYSRFDGLLQPQVTETEMMDWRRRYYTEKSDEEFWRNPYGRPRARAPSQEYKARAFHRPLRPVYPSYPGHRVSNISTDDNPCVPSPALAEAEAGYLYVLNQGRERYDSVRWRSSDVNVNDGGYGGPHEKRGYDSSRLAPATYGYSKNGKEPDYAMQPEAGAYGQPLRPPPAASAAFGRYDTIGVRAGKDEMYRKVDDAEGPPAFFVRTSYAEGPYNDTGTYTAESPTNGTGYYGGGGGSGGKYVPEEAYDAFGEEESTRRREKSRGYTLPEYAPFGPE